MKPTALIYGGTGFVGGHLGRQLADRYRIVAVGREHNITQPETVSELVARAEPEIVVNLAAITTVRESVEQPRTTYEIALLGTLNLLEAMSVRGASRGYLHVSSSEVYGYPAVEDLPLKEEAPLRPMSPYAVGKAAGELLCQASAQSSPFSIFIVRPFTHIGPGQSTRFSVARFASEIAEIVAGRRAAVLSVGELATTRDLTDVRDVVRAYDLILHRGKPGTVYNVCSAREIAMGDVLDELIRQSRVRIRAERDPSQVRDNEQRRLRGSFERLREHTGWEPQWPLTKTLSDIRAAAGVPVAADAVIKRRGAAPCI